MSDQTQDDRLWTNERINFYAQNASNVMEANRILGLMMQVRDDYEQRLAAVVAERDEWRERHAHCTTSFITAERQVERLKAERDQLRQRVAELAASVDEEALTIAYAMGYAAAQDKARQQQEADNE